MYKNYCIDPIKKIGPNLTLNNHKLNWPLKLFMNIMYHNEI